MSENNISVERDFAGTLHIKVGDFDYIQVRYQYPHTDNASTRAMADRIVALLDQPAEADGVARYDMDTTSCDSFGQDCGAEMEPYALGEWVKYDDHLAALSAQQPSQPEFCCEHSYKVAKQAAWGALDLTQCKCDHNEYCEHCWPYDFREGGKWYGGFEQQSAPERVSVPVDRIKVALEAVQNAMEDAYNNAYQNCCGRGNGQCCGNPEPAWSDADQAIMDALAPAQRELSALLASHAEGGKV